MNLDAVRPGDPEPLLDFEESLAAFRRVCDRSRAHLESHRAGGATVGRLPWTAAHLFAHAGEMAAIGSLAGMADLDLPGETPHSAGWTGGQ
ncbi:MAG: hypothetical protein GEU80_11670 [Dehalococcoidia bacterium]|nr:hypothetical protein [Dehalococcoidia bacterium]